MGILDEDLEKDEINNLESDFYDKFGHEEIEFNKESETIRSVEWLSKNKGVIFVHSIPLDGITFPGNTSMNNDLMYTENLNTEERLSLLVNEKPVVSCSTVKLKKNKSGAVIADNADRETFGPFGVVVGQGTVLSAHRFDSGTVAVNDFSKYRKYDKNDPLNGIQPKISAQMEHALEGPFSYDYIKKVKSMHGHVDGIDSRTGSYGTRYNEIVVSSPIISGFYISEAGIKKAFTDEKNKSILGYLSNLSILKKYSNVPIYVKHDNGITCEYFINQEGELQPVIEEGKIDPVLPEKTLQDYDFKEVKKATKIETELLGQSYHVNFSNLADSLNERFKKTEEYFIHIYSSIDSILNNIDRIKLLIDSGAITEEDIANDILKDFSLYLKGANDGIERIEKMAVEENNHVYLSPRSRVFSSMYNVYKNQISTAREQITSFIEKLRESGLEKVYDIVLNNLDKSK